MLPSPLNDVEFDTIQIDDDPQLARKVQLLGDFGLYVSLGLYDVVLFGDMERIAKATPNSSLVFDRDLLIIDAERRTGVFNSVSVQFVAE